MDFRRLLFVSIAGIGLAGTNAYAAGMNCVGPANAQLCTDAFGNQAVVNRSNDGTRVHFSSVNKNTSEENTAAMMTDSGWQTDEMPTGTIVDPALSYKLDHVSVPLPPAPTH